MKKALSFAVCLLALVTLFGTAPASAQNAFSLHDKVISGGIGFGAIAGYFGTSTTPPLWVAFETGLPLEEIKKLTIGGIVGYSGSSEDFYYAKWSYTYIFIGVTGNYHFLEHNEKLDAYAGLGLGYDIVSSSVEYKAGYSQLSQYSYSAGASFFQYDFHLGARYYFTPKFGVMAELGYGFGLFRVGVAYKF
jgi:hypothetical protein